MNKFNHLRRMIDLKVNHKRTIKSLNYINFERIWSHFYHCFKESNIIDFCFQIFNFLEKMTFNMNSAFKMMAIVHGNYDGQKFVNDGRSALLYGYCRFWIIFTIYNFIRFMILVILPRDKHLYLEFYLCDFGSVIKGKSYKLMILIGPLFHIWLLSYFLLFQRINYSKKDRYWLK